MSKVLTQQNAPLPQQQQSKNAAENHKKTTPTVQMHSNNSKNNSSSGVLNGTPSMRGNTVCGTMVCSSESPSTSSSPVTVDYDDFTSSSILEFLAREQECCTDADAESIFQEVGRLADNSDTRSVDEILREAELLMKQQSVLGTANKTERVGQLRKRAPKEMEKIKMPSMKQPQQGQQTPPLHNIKLNTKYTRSVENICPIQKQSQNDASSTRLIMNGNCSYKEQAILQKGRSAFCSASAASSTAATPLTPLTPSHATLTPQTPTSTSTAATPINGKLFDVFVENLPSVSVISEESTPKDMQNMNATDADVTTMALLNGDDDDDTDTVSEGRLYASTISNV